MMESFSGLLVRSGNAAVRWTRHSFEVALEACFSVVLINRGIVIG